MRKSWKPLLSVLLVMLMLSAALVGCTAPAAETPSAPPAATTADAPATTTDDAPADVDVVKIGVVSCITGSNSESGRQNVLGARLAEKYINDNGGIKALGGAKVELVLIDSTSDANNSALAVERALDANPDIVAINGNATSSMTLPMLPVLQKYEIPAICSTAANSTITEQGCDFIFQPGSDGRQFSELQLEFIQYYAEIKGLDLKEMKIGIVFENSAWGQDTAAGNKKNCEEAGLNVVVEETYPVSGFSDASPIVTKLKNAGVDILLPASYVNDTKLILNTMEAMDYKPLIVAGGSAFVWPAFSKDLGESAEGILSAANWVWDNKHAMNVAEFKDVIEPMYREINGEFMGEQVGPSFAGTMMIYEAIEETGSTDSVEIRDYIRTMTGENSQWFAILHGDSKFNENGKNIGNKPVIGQWQGGEMNAVFPLDVAAKKLIDPFTLEVIN
ncbi:MAG: ABC transporter substrate-binding protein [Christensenellales bacterium]